MRLLKASLLTTVLCCSPMISQAAEPLPEDPNNITVLTMAIGEWPPLMSKSLVGEGPLVRLMSDIFLMQGIEVHYEWYPWKRAFLLSKNGEIAGTYPWSRNPEREEEFLYSDVMMQSDTVIYHLKSTNFDWNKYEDLVNYKVSVVNGYSYGAFQPYLDKMKEEGNPNYDSSKNEIIAFKKLFANRADIYFIEPENGEEFLKKYFTPEQKRLVTYHQKPLHSLKYHYIIAKKYPHAQYIIDNFNKGLKMIRTNKKYKSYFEKQ